jgi:phage protein D
MADAAEQGAPSQTIDLEALKAELNAELLAEMQAKASTAVLQESAPVADPWLEEYVQVQLFKDGKDYKDDVFVSVNGENCVIKRGYPVKIKRKFALVLEQSQQQDVKAAEYAEAMQREFDQQVKYFNL